MSSETLSDKIAALVRDGEELSNGELISIVHDAHLSCTEGIQADIFTYNGRTLILAADRAAARAPLRYAPEETVARSPNGQHKLLNIKMMMQQR